MIEGCALQAPQQKTVLRRDLKEDKGGDSMNFNCVRVGRGETREVFAGKQIGEQGWSH